MGADILDLEADTQESGATEALAVSAGVTAEATEVNFVEKSTFVTIKVERSHNKDRLCTMTLLAVEFNSKLLSFSGYGGYGGYFKK